MGGGEERKSCTLRLLATWPTLLIWLRCLGTRSVSVYGSAPSGWVTLRMSQKKIDVNLSTSLPWDFSRFICSDDWGGKKPLGLSHFCLFNFFFSSIFFDQKHILKKVMGIKTRSTCLRVKKIRLDIFLVGFCGIFKGVGIQYRVFTLEMGLWGILIIHFNHFSSSISCFQKKISIVLG